MAAKKKEEINLTKSAQANVDEMATTIWGQLFTPNTEDAEKNSVAYKDASDKLQKLFDGLRQRRDDSKPVLRERLDTDEVIKDSIGKPVSELQTAFVQLPIGKDEKGNDILDRHSLPKIRQFAEITTHPMHEAATAFLASHGVRFVERENTTGGKGRRSKTVFEAVPAETPAKAA